MRTQANTQNVAIYCRLSKDDGANNESDSIASQKSMLLDYAKTKCWKIIDIYTDDGFTGLNFDRPDFQRMLSDIKSKKINCIITKDLSRLGRDYAGMGYYLDTFFPENRIRYISVTESIDSLDNKDNALDITPFKNVMNEYYSRDISIKVKTNLRIRLKDGKYIGSYAPYGYKKDPNNKNHLIIDEDTEAMVKKIFQLAKQGWGVKRIGTYLNNNLVPTPAETLCMKLKKTGEKIPRNWANTEFLWSEMTVRRILTDQVYIGNIVGHKVIKPSLKSKKRIALNPCDFIVVENTHDNIISKNDYDIVQKLIISRKKTYLKKSGYTNIFAGLLKCSDCSWSMITKLGHRKRKNEPIDNVYYDCGKYHRYGNKGCSSHSIEARNLYNIILGEIKLYARMAKNNDKTLFEEIKQILNRNLNYENNDLTEELKNINLRLDELNTIICNLYEDKALKKINSNTFETLIKRFELEQGELTSRFESIKIITNQTKNSKNNVSNWIDQVKNYSDIDELTEAVLHTLIERITIGKKQIIEGVVKYPIKIYYNHIGLVSV